VSIFTNIVKWAAYCMANEPKARDSVKTWDKWYRDFANLEPFLAGSLASAVQIDKNRGWSLTGGRNQVSQYTKRLHSFAADLTGIGWRPHVEWLANSYYTTQMGFVGEVGSQGEGGPLTNMWAVDPCRCELTGNSDAELRYTPRQGGAQEWRYGIDFVRGCSQRSTAEEKFGYGMPAVARCYSLAKIMVGVYRHYQSKVGITTPDGILAHNAMTDEQWQQAMTVRNQELSSDPDNYINSLIAVGNPGGEVPQFVLTMLPSLPDRFDVEQWTLILMRGYQLAFGYGAGEFYPESYGVVGRGKEQEMQHSAATGKGGKDFALSHTEQLQSRLPATLEFGYDERAVSGQIEDANLAAAQAAVITEISKWTVKAGGTETSVMTPAQLMQLAAEKGVVPEEWTPQDEDVTGTDEDAPGDSERVQRAMRAFPDEPIVRYSYSPATGKSKTRVLRNVHRKVFAMPQVKRTVGQVINEYNERLRSLVYNTWNRIQNGLSDAATMQAALRTEHKRLIRDLSETAYGEGMREGGVDPDEMDDEDLRTITTWRADQSSYANQFAEAVTAAAGDEAARLAITGRVDLWVAAMRDLGNMGILSAQKNAMYRFDGEDGADTCPTCQSLKGKEHRAKWWAANGLIPSVGNANFKCGCWKCQHYLVDRNGNRLQR